MDPLQQQSSHARNQGELEESFSCKECETSFVPCYEKLPNKKFFVVQVIVNNPVPEEKKQNPDSFEDTLLLLDIIKEKKMNEMKTKKVCYNDVQIVNTNRIEPLTY